MYLCHEIRKKAANIRILYINDSKKLINIGDNEIYLKNEFLMAFWQNYQNPNLIPNISTFLTEFKINKTPTEY